MAGELAYNPDTGELLYSPNNGNNPAKDCASGPDPSPCSNSWPYVNATYTWTGPPLLRDIGNGVLEPSGSTTKWCPFFYNCGPTGPTAVETWQANELYLTAGSITPNSRTGQWYVDGFVQVPVSGTYYYPYSVTYGGSGYAIQSVRRLYQTGSVTGAGAVTNNQDTVYLAYGGTIQSVAPDAGLFTPLKPGPGLPIDSRYNGSVTTGDTTIVWEIAGDEWGCTQ